MRAKKRFGQHFLSGQNYIHRILESVSPTDDDALIEIGPGRGAITRLLIEKAPHLTVIEIDRDLIPALETLKDQYPHFTVVSADILKTPLAQFAENGKKLRVVGNLPYNIGSLILLNLVREREAISEAFVMVQREVGDRLTALHSTSDYSFLSVAMQTYSTIKRLFILPPGAFSPPPKVDSAFLRVSLDKGENLPPPEPYFLMVTRAFSQRRKKVINTLVKHYPEPLVRSFFESQHISENARAENLSVETFQSLYAALHD